jgi:hypothetical protein
LTLTAHYFSLHKLENPAKQQHPQRTNNLSTTHHHVLHPSSRGPPHSCRLHAARCFQPVNSPHRWQGVGSPYVDVPPKRGLNWTPSEPRCKLKPALTHNRQRRPRRRSREEEARPAAEAEGGQEQLGRGPCVRQRERRTCYFTWVFDMG